MKKQRVLVKYGDDLYKLSKQKEIYQTGYLVGPIDLSDESIIFSNGQMLYVGETQGGMTEAIMKFQIRKTIEEHLRKEKKLNKQGIKVLSLFFIDKVATYFLYSLYAPSDCTLISRFYIGIRVIPLLVGLFVSY